MKESQSKPNADTTGADTTGLDDVGRLIHLAGAREAVEKERFERVRENVHQHWQQVVSDQIRPAHRKRFRIMAVAASLVVMAGAVLYSRM